MILALIASLFIADGPLESSGWTKYQDNPNDRMYVKDGTLHCEFSPGEANKGMVYGIDVPYYERGELSYEIMPRYQSSGSSSDYYMPIRLGTFYMFLHGQGMERICYEFEPNYFAIGTSMFAPANWTKVRIVWDNERQRVKYYVGDMTRPNKIEYGHAVGPGYGDMADGKMQLRIYNYARAAVTETHLIRNFEVKEYVPPAIDENLPRTKAVVFRGLTSAFYPLDEWTSGFASDDVVKFNLDYSGYCITTSNKVTISAFPEDDLLRKAKLIILCDMPFKTEVLPRAVQEDILDAVRAGAQLVVTGGYSGLEKGGGMESPLAAALPVAFSDPWHLPTPKNGKAVAYYGKGEISVILKRTFRDDEYADNESFTPSPATARGLIGDWQVFDGTGDWPTSGNVIVSAALTVDAAEKAAAVARWQQAYLDAGTSLAFADLSSELEVMANLKGAGAVSATNCAKITLSGDNRAHVGTGDWLFTDTDLHIGNEYALGKGGTHRAVFDYTTATIADGLHLTIGWEGTKSYTNHVPIIWKHNSFARIGSSAADETFVQDGDMFIQRSSGNATLTFFGRYEQTAGTFGWVATQKVWFLYLRNGKCYGEGPVYSSSGDSAVVTLSGTTRISAGNVEAVDGSREIYALGPEIHLANSGGISAAGWRVDVGALIFHEPDTQTPVPEGSRAPHLSPYLMNTGHYKNKFDLRGNDTTFGFLSAVGAVSEKTATYYYLTSDEPATLTLANAPAGTTAVAPAELRGALSLAVANGCTNYLANRATSTTGDLVITNGLFGLKWNAVWQGANLILGDDGVLDLEAGTSLTVGQAWVDGVELYRGTYAIAELRAAYPGYFAGDDAAVVNVTNGWQLLDDTVSSADWPRDGKVKVVGDVVVSNAEQSAAMADWAQLWLTDGSSFAISNDSAATTIAAAITGTGSLAAWDSGKITLSGDNRGYAGTGDWVFNNTFLHLGGEWALGPKSDSRRAVLNHYSATDLSEALTVGWEGQSSFTNHTHIIWRSLTAGKALNITLGPSAANQWFVQDGDMLYQSSSGSPWFFVVGQYEQISGRFGRSVSGVPALYLRGHKSGDYSGGRPVARFTGNGRVVSGLETSVNCGNVWCAGVTLEFGSAVGNHVAGFHYDQNTLRLLTDNALEDSVAKSGVAPLYPSLFDQQTYRNALDLNGHDVRLGALSHYYSTVPTATSVAYSPIYSATPATITLTNPKGTAKEYLTAVSVSGPVSLIVDNSCTNLLATKVSPSTGTLVVRRGSVLGFKWGGGWSGPLEIRGGQLLLDATAPLQVASLFVNGKPIPAGSYTGSELIAAYPNAFVGSSLSTVAVSATAASANPFAFYLY